MKIIEFAQVLGKLKKIKRSGWIRHQVSDSESIAEHSFRVAVLAMILASKVGANQLKVIKMALIHDLGEAEIGDVITRKGKKILPNFSEKQIKEKAAIEKIFSLIGEREFVDLFNEYEENKTKEARFVKQVDKLEMALQAQEYKQDHQVDLEDFFEEAREIITDKRLKEILDEVENLRI